MALGFLGRGYFVQIVSDLHHCFVRPVICYLGGKPCVMNNMEQLVWELGGRLIQLFKPVWGGFDHDLERVRFSEQLWDTSSVGGSSLPNLPKRHVPGVCRVGILNSRGVSSGS